MGRLLNISYNLYHEDGVLRRCKGRYLIVDGGYKYLSCLYLAALQCTRLRDYGRSEIWNQSEKMLSVPLELKKIS